ncbi:MAG TPA: DUF1501 domain-containing protein [Gemmataceae bacterium]|jgi:hypothetical protein|nr:DUF1501 domain-containing protein [Gemmataceae bacterium]
MTHPSRGCTRRGLIRSLVGGSLLLPGILSQLLADDAPEPHETADPLTPKKPHFEPKAKRVIFLFSPGGVSHMDTFDHKPKLFAADGKMMGGGGGISQVQRPLLKPRWEFKPGGKCGTMVSDIFPHIREQMDNICLIRSMTTDHIDHFEATLAVHSGSFTFARPSLGSWISYGLGTFNQNLPSFIVIAPALPYAGTQVFSNDFLPAYHQGTRVLPGKEPIPNVQRQAALGDLQDLELELANAFNRKQLKRIGATSELAARIKTFETAYKMQVEAPKAFDLSKETDETLKLYGLRRGQTDSFGWQCLVARRLAEHGVRFVELIDTGSSNNWDAHENMASHEPLAKKIDQPIAGLIQDLKRRGMLNDTLVVWTTEFGRTPGQDFPLGRGHHPAVYSSWLAGAGIKAGIAHGRSDEIGATVAENKVHVHDLHATILHLLGLNHEKLTYRHAGRDFRLTDVYGNVVKEIIA